MDATTAVRTKLDVREFSDRTVPNDVKLAVLEAARLTQSGINSQHWRFILVQDPKSIATLATDSTSGGWVSGANFAVIVCTDPKRGFHLLDAGRAVQDMQLTAWDKGVASGMYTGVNQSDIRRDFGVPDELTTAVVVAFGHPAKRLLGRKKRKPLAEVAFLEKYGATIDPLRE